MASYIINLQGSPAAVSAQISAMETVLSLPPTQQAVVQNVMATMISALAPAPVGAEMFVYANVSESADGAVQVKAMEVSQLPAITT